MEVNLKKTEVVVFRNGGKTSKSERFFHRNRSVEIVTYYRYLGLKKCMAQSIINLGLTGRESSQYCEENEMEGGTSKIACFFKEYLTAELPLFYVMVQRFGVTRIRTK